MKEKVLVLSDIHSPFHREDEIIEIINQHKFFINTMIFAGDLIDCESVSSFPKEQRKSLVEEMVITYKFLDKIDKLTPNIRKIIIMGNHEYRYNMYLAKNYSELNSFHSNNIIRNMVEGFTVYSRSEGEESIHYPRLSDNFTVIDNWFVQYNDMIVAHPKSFSKIPLKTVTMALEYFMSYGYNFNTILIGHTHKLGSAMRSGKWMGEIGCLCKEMEYAKNGNLGYTPQSYGYALITMEDGKTIINESQIYTLDL